MVGQITMREYYFLREKEEDEMKKTIFVILVLTIVSTLFLSACEDPNKPIEGMDKYFVILLNGEKRSLNYPYCVSYTDQRTFTSSDGFFVKCGHYEERWWGWELMIEYQAQIISFEKEEK